MCPCTKLLDKTLIIFGVLALAVLQVNAEAQPGEVFREYTYLNRFNELDPLTTRKELLERGLGTGNDRVLEITDMAKAVRAEAVVEFWGGHIGTSGQAFRVNGSHWIDLPQPEGTPTAPQCYYRTLLKATVPIPLDLLKSGPNVFQFKAGPQICHSFNWGFYWVYAFTVRIFYDPSRPHPTGQIISHSDGGSIGDMARFIASAESPVSAISRVEFVGKYEDYNWEGDGVWRQWHYHLERGQLRRHIGTATDAPYAVTWDSRWIPDQTQPVEIAARITDSLGMTYMTPVVRINLNRTGRSVRMYRSSNVPEKFGVRKGLRLTCKIHVGDSLQKIRNARLVLSTWSAAHADEIGLNGQKLLDRVGFVHNYSFDSIPIPARLVREGENTFHIFSETEHHAAEVNWPGPVLLVEFIDDGAPLSRHGAWTERDSEFRLSIEVDAAGYERLDKPVQLDLDTAKLVAGIGSAAPQALTPVRVVEIDHEGQVIEPDLPFQYDAAPSGRNVTFLLKGRTEAHQTRRYEIYFGWRGGDAQAPRFPALIRVTDNIEWEGQKSFRIETENADYIYHKEGAGFASMIDKEGKDWIGYRPSGGSAGNFRGIPNLGPDFGHPGYTGEKGAETRLVAAGPLRATLVSESRDKQWECRWEIFPRYARMTLTKNGAPYWFLYEGTPAGKLNLESGYLVFSTGERKSLSERWSGEIAAPRWAFFGDPDSMSALFLVDHQADHAPDQYYQMQSNMTVFGFGRQFTCCGRYLTKTPSRFTIGFAPRSDIASTTAHIDSAFRDVIVRTGRLEHSDDARH